MDEKTIQEIEDKYSLVEYEKEEVREKALLLYTKREWETLLDFYFIDVISCSVDDVPIEWRIMYHGNIFFDGVRHLYFWDEFMENEGYDYYADIDLHMFMLNKIQEMEVSIIEASEKESDNYLLS